MIMIDDIANSSGIIVHYGYEKLSIAIYQLHSQLG